MPRARSRSRRVCSRGSARGAPSSSLSAEFAPSRTSCIACPRATTTAARSRGSTRSGSESAPRSRRACTTVGSAAGAGAAAAAGGGAGSAALARGRLPAPLVARRKLPSPAAALRALHAPALDADLAALAAAATPAHERLILEELYLLELGLALRRDGKRRAPGIAIRVDGPRLRTALRELPFALTGAQQRAWRELAADLARPHPMSRLLEGDVGSGKTVIAYLAAAAVAEAGHQTALMAPTELLAEPHYRTLHQLVGGSSLRIELFTASAAPGHADRIRGELAAGEIDVAGGTHPPRQA